MEQAEWKVVEEIESLGTAIIAMVESLGAVVTFLGVAIFYIFAPPYKFGLAIRQIKEIGFDSIVLIVLIAASIGAVLGLQGANTLTRFGAGGSLGSVVALVLVRELGPVLAALMITARAGSAMAAELGSMQATEQIDALTVMAINPVQYLVSPRIVAGLVSFPLLTFIFDVVGIMGGYVVGVGLMGVPSSNYFNGIAYNLVWHDISTGIWKALVFGLVVTWICCYKGYNAERMATGISRATTEAVVASSVLILVWDYFLTSILL